MIKLGQKLPATSIQQIMLHAFLPNLNHFELNSQAHVNMCGSASSGYQACSKDPPPIFLKLTSQTNFVHGLDIIIRQRVSSHVQLSSHNFLCITERSAWVLHFCFHLHKTCEQDCELHFTSGASAGRARGGVLGHTMDLEVAEPVCGCRRPSDPTERKPHLPAAELVSRWEMLCPRCAY